MVKAKAENMGHRKRWNWVVAGALIAIFVAVAVSLRTSPNLSLIGLTRTPCRCAKVNSSPCFFFFFRKFHFSFS
jgi:hypothetical protein